MFPWSQVTSDLHGFRKGAMTMKTWERIATLLVLLAGLCLSASGQILTTLYTFSPVTNIMTYCCGQGTFTNTVFVWPSSLIQGSDGSFYGMTTYGGTNMLCTSNSKGALTNCVSAGTIFKVTSTGAFTNLHQFAGPDGSYPGGATVGYTQGGLIQGSDGYFYGSTDSGGTSTNCLGGCGTVFKIDSNGVFATLYNFTSGADGANPYGTMAQGGDGNFYGAAFTVDGYASVFKVTSAGTLTTVFSVNNYYVAGLVRGADGNVYGTFTDQGGQQGNGNVFKIAPDGTLTLLYVFTGGADGSWPNGLVQGNDGNFYGTAQYDGAWGWGTVFKITPAGTLTPLYQFTGEEDGYNPLTTLVQGSDGNFYGTTSNGGTNGNGSVFWVDPSGNFTNLYTFVGPSIETYAPAALVQGSDGNFYGTAVDGRAGVVFALSVPLNPAPNQVCGMQLVGTNVLVTLPAVSLETYQLQFCSSMTTGSWSNIPGAVISNSFAGPLTLTNFGGASGPQGFYRFAITP
jgi:uncharacterized repeat protein (TIGR03803 family)